MSAIFISHSSQDAAMAAELRTWLQSKGHRSVFLDFDPVHGIPAGRNWEQELYRQLRSCRAVVVLWSENSVNSKWCFVEVAQSRSLGKALLSVRIDGVAVDSSMTDHQWIDLTVNKEEGYQRLWLGLLGAGLDPADAFDWDHLRSPYPGLMSFQEEDAGVFFGRDDEISAGLDAMNRVRRLGAAGFVVALGGSGSGKSSLVRAGLVPRLRRDPGRWLVVPPFRPRDDAYRELAGALARSFADAGLDRPWPSIRDELIASSGGGAAANSLVRLAHELRLSTHQPEAKVVLVVDQFEEVFAQASSSEMLSLLRDAAELSDGPLMVLATLRSDFLGVLQKRPELLDLQFEALSVGPLSTEDVANIIEQPARVGGFEVESALAQAMIADAHGEDALPLLAFSLRELADKAGRDGTLTVRNYREQLGGLEGAVARVAEEVTAAARLTADQEVELRSAFLSMVRLTEDDRWVRRAAPVAAFSPSVRPILERFVNARLLVAAGETNESRLEVAHEALFRSWGRLVEWLNESVDDLRLQRDVRVAAMGWEQGGRDSSDLWRGVRLARLIELVEHRPEGLDPLALEFARAAGDAEHSHIAEVQRRRHRTVRALGGVAVVMSLLAGAAVVSFLAARRQTERANDRTRSSQVLALVAQSKAQLDTNPALALALASESARIMTPPMPEALQALVDARFAFGRPGLQPIGLPVQLDWAFASTLAVSPDSRVVAIGGFGVVQMFDLQTHAPIGDEINAGDGPISAVRFSPDGKMLAVAGLFSEVNLVSVATGEVAASIVPSGESLAIWSLDFSPDGSMIALGNDDGVHILDVETTKEIGKPLIGHAGAVYDVDFNPDGTTLASAGADGSVRMWDVATGLQVGEPLKVGDVPQRVVAFSPDGSRLAAGGEDRYIATWDPVTRASVDEPVDAGGFLRSIAYSPDGRQIVTGGEDAKLRVWSATTMQLIAGPLDGHVAAIYDAAYSPDGRTLVSLDFSGQVRFWSPSAGVDGGEVLSNSEDVLYSAAFSADSQYLVTGGDAGVLSLWNSQDGSLVESVAASGSALLSVAFAVDGTTIATADADGVVKLWSAPDLKPQRVLPGHEGAVNALSFSHDGTLLASVGDDATLVVWNVADGVQIGVGLSDVFNGMRAVAFSPDDSMIATGDGSPGYVSRWDAKTVTRLGEPVLIHVVGVNTLAFSPDGGTLASGGNDAAVVLLDLSNADAPWRQLDGHVGGVSSVTYSADGSMLVSGGMDGTVRFWDTSSATPLLRTGRTGRVPVWTTAISPDGSITMASTDSGSVYVWHELLNPTRACELAAPYVTASQLAAFIPDGVDAKCVLAKG